MKNPPYPGDETARQLALDETGLVGAGAEERFDRITRLAKQLFCVPIALITLVDGDRQWFKSRQGVSAEETSRRISFCGHAILAEAPLVVENALDDPRFADNPLVTGPPAIRFYAGVPLHSASGHRIGTLCLIDTSPRRLNVDQMESLRDLGATAEELILADAQRRNQTASMQTALTESEQRAALVIEGTRIGTWEWNVQTGYAVFNQRLAEIVGYTLDDLEPVSVATWERLVHPDDHLRSCTLLEQYFAGEAEIYDCKLRMRHKQGHWVWVHDRGQVLRRMSDGTPLLMYGTHVDITEEVKARQALEASRDEFSSFIANLPGVSYRCLLNSHRTMLYISRQVDLVTGYPAEALVNDVEKSYGDLIHDGDADRVKDSIHAAVVEGSEWHVEYRIVHRDGGVRWVEERGRATPGGVDEPLVLEGFFVDTTTEYVAREKLARNHDALTLLNEIAFNKEGDLGMRINAALDNALAYLDMDAAIVSQIDADTYTVRWASTAPDMGPLQGQSFPVGETWCQLLFEHEHSELFIESSEQDEWHAHPCYRTFPLGAYAGVLIEVERRTFGTLNFSSRCPRRVPFDESERLFIRLFARWLGDELERAISTERLDKLFDQVPGIIYQYRRFPDGSSVFPFSSPGIEAVYGITPTEAAVDASAAFAVIHPDDLDSVATSIQQSSDNLETWQATYRIRAGDGSYRWHAGQARPEALADGSVLWHGYIRDIDQQERARRALERSEGRLRSLFDFAPIGIALNDLETGDFLELNDALLEPSGYSRDEFVSLSYWDVTPSEYQPEEEKALENLRNEGRYGPFEKEYIRKDGSRYPVRLQGILSHEPDGRAVIWSLIEDITERRRIDKMKDEFIATVSHELRTPLTSVNGSIGLLASGAAGDLPEKALSLLGNAQRNGGRLAALIDDLLDIEKLVAGHMSMNMQRFDVESIVSEAIDSISDLAVQHNITIRPPTDYPKVSVRVDASRFTQAMNNLVSNAIKFSPEFEAVEVDVQVDDMNMVLRVRDRGPGVDPSFQTQLFTRFAQAQSGDKRKFPGTGLGLAITREITEQMGGAVEYQDAPGGGSCFLIRLPVADFY